MSSKTDRKRLDAAAAAFHGHYSSPQNWGAERWSGSLFTALSHPVKHANLVNLFVAASPPETVWKKVSLPQLASSKTELASTSATTLVAYTLSTDDRDDDRDDTTLPTNGKKLELRTFPPPAPQPSLSLPTTPLLSHYLLDAASLIPVILLDPRPGDSILDMCASPGGKSLAMAQLLFGPYATSITPATIPSAMGPHAILGTALHVNEHNPPRFTRLQRNLSSYLPPSLLSSGQVRALKLDAASASFASQLRAAAATTNTARGSSSNDTSGLYEKVLLDAPCSSERHVIHAHHAAAKAGRASPEMLSFRAGVAGKKGIVKLQSELLLNALRVVKVGGRLVYSTCSIDQAENEGVVMSVVAKIGKGREGFGVEVVGLETLVEGLEEWGEKREVGRICLPDQGGGWGPLYYCVLRKTAVT